MADTWTTGGATSGYWAIGKRKYATTPRITITMESTVAKIGRSMKKFENMERVLGLVLGVARSCKQRVSRMRLLGGRGDGRRGLGNRLDGIVQPRPLHSFGNDPRVRLQFRRQNDAHPVVQQAAKLDVHAA